MPTIRWGVIGCGAVTEVKSLPAYRQVRGFSVEGIFCRNAARATDFAARHAIPNIFESAEVLIASCDIDAVYIATPPDSHARYALQVAEAGKICCVEKPMASDYTSAVAMHEAFEKVKKPLFVAYYRRLLPRFLQVKEWIESGEIGEVRHVDWQLHKPPNEIDLSGRYNWRTDAKIAYGGYFDDVGSHGIDLITFLLGEIETVHGIARNNLNLYSAKDSVTACWLHRNGVTGTGSWNFGAHSREDRLTIRGSRGKISCSVLDEAPLLLENKVGVTQWQIENPKHIQYYHVENMAKALRGERDHPSTGKTALHTAWVMESILKMG